MSNVCKYNGATLNGDCPLQYSNVSNYSDRAIEFGENLCWNSISCQNVKSSNMGNSDDRLRLINGPLKVAGDVYVEGDIIGLRGMMCSNSVDQFKVDDMLSKIITLEEKLTKTDKIIDYFLERFSVNIDEIEREIKNLETRNDYNKRLDAIP